MRPFELENSVGAHVTFLQKDSTKTIVKMLRMGRATLHSLVWRVYGIRLDANCCQHSSDSSAAPATMLG